MRHWAEHNWLKCWSKIPFLWGYITVMAQNTAGLEPFWFTTNKVSHLQTMPNYILLPSSIWLTSSLYGYLGVAWGDGIWLKTRARVKCWLICNIWQLLREREKRERERDWCQVGRWKSEEQSLLNFYNHTRTHLRAHEATRLPIARVCRLPMPSSSTLKVNQHTFVRLC